MANPTANLSPEEKLLRVIQGGGKKPEGGNHATGGAQPPPEAPPQAAAPPVAANPTPAVAPSAAERKPVTAGAPAAPPNDKGKLKLAKDAAAAGGRATTSPSVKDAKPAPKEAAAKPSAHVPAGHGARSAAGPDLSLRVVNIVLAVAVLIMLLLTGNVIWANVRVQNEPPRVGPVALPAAGGTEEGALLPALDEVLDGFDQRPLFAVAERREEKHSEPQSPPPRDFCKMMGISVVEGRQEAIVQDTKNKKMLYLKIGDVVTGDGQPWTVHDIQGDRVVFRSGKRESVVQ